MFGSLYYPSKIGFRTVFGGISTYWCKVWVSLLHCNNLPSKFIVSTMFGGICTHWWIVRGYRIGFRSIIGDISTYWCNAWLSLLLLISFPSKIGFRTVFGGISTYWCNVWVSLLHFKSIPSKLVFNTTLGGISTYWWIVRGYKIGFR